MITEKEGYHALFYFIKNWYDLTKLEDFGELLSLMESLEDGQPADPVMWDYWLEAIQKTKNTPPPSKKLEL